MEIEYKITINDVKFLQIDLKIILEMVEETVRKLKCKSI